MVATGGLNGTRGSVERRTLESRRRRPSAFGMIVECENNSTSSHSVARGICCEAERVGDEIAGGLKSTQT